MNKIKAGDEIVVIAGKDKGKRGKIRTMMKGGEYVIVEGINVAKKHVRGNPNAGIQGGIVPKEMPIHRSNVKVYDPNSQKGSRVGIRTLTDGQRVRFLKASGQLIEVKE